MGEQHDPTNRGRDEGEISRSGSRKGDLPSSAAHHVVLPDSPSPVGRTIPSTTDLFNSLSPGRRPSSPLDTSEQLPAHRHTREYALPDRGSLPATSTARHRMSVPSRSRRPSPLLHEIQPPSRRLSAHQMLLLTPFGGAISASTRGLSRGESSLGDFSAFPAPPRMRSVAANGPSMPEGTMLMRMSTTSLMPRLRHHSLMNPGEPSSSLSAPMETIQSVSEHGSSEGSAQGGVERKQDNSVKATAAGVPDIVPMTRSNSLPILTLRELMALKQKDGELGIARGGDYAWVSRESGEEEGANESFEGDVSQLSTDSMASYSSLSLASGSSTAPPSRFSFTNPFASPAGSSMVREITAIDNTLNPAATSPGYHYSPHDDTRRVSETASAAWTGKGPRPLDPLRRPSAPGPSRTSISGRSALAGPSGLSPVRRTARKSYVPPRSESPTGTPGSSPPRPRLMRYKSSPGRSSGLGLQIVVRPQTDTNPANAVPPGPSEPPESDHGSETSGVSPAAPIRATARPRHSGSWTPVDLVDSLAAGAEGDSTKTSPSAASFQSTLLVSSRAQRLDLGGRSRFESVDSALPLLAGRFDTLPTSRGIWSSTFPRRGSLAVLSRTPLGPWAVMADETKPAGHWSDRRGSWAER